MKTQSTNGLQRLGCMIPKRHAPARIGFCGAGPRRPSAGSVAAARGTSERLSGSQPVGLGKVDEAGVAGRSAERVGNSTVNVAPVAFTDTVALRLATECRV